MCFTIGRVQHQTVLLSCPVQKLPFAVSLLFLFSFFDLKSMEWIVYQLLEPTGNKLFVSQVRADLVQSNSSSPALSWCSLKPCPLWFLLNPVSSAGSWAFNSCLSAALEKPVSLFSLLLIKVALFYHVCWNGYSSVSFLCLSWCHICKCDFIFGFSFSLMSVLLNSFNV